MPAPKAIWAIDIGTNSLKALRVGQGQNKIEALGLDYIEYPKNLAAEGITPDVKAQVIGDAINTFISRNDVAKDQIAISVPGQSSFARFIKLPPVEPKKVPEIIKFEAIQQIPFDINEVEWDWQLMEKQDSPETEVGIFAIKNELINSYMENFSAANLRVNLVQMSPIALYNYAWYDRAELDDENKKAVVLLDMGADNTNLVVCTKSSVWQRCIPLGGNNFTKAIAEAFKLDFEKADKLKKGAPMSKYARQIFHAMKPVFTDLGAEIQRSLGYYSNSHKGCSFTKIVLFGGGFKLQGLNKYLQQATQLPVIKPDSFETLAAAANVSNAKLHDNISDFAIVYGLGLQGLGLAKIQSNLLPARIARAMMWAQKSKMFIIAACILVAVSIIAFLKTSAVLKAYSLSQPTKYRAETKQIIQKARTAGNKLRDQESRDSGYEQIIQQYSDMFKYRDVVPLLHEVLLETLPNSENNPSQKQLYEAYAAQDAKAVMQIPRKQRKQLFVTRIGMNYTESIANAPLQIAELSSTKRTAISRSASPAAGMDMGMGMGMGMAGDFAPQFTPQYDSRSSRRSSRSSKKVEEQKEETDGEGFVIIMEGYCPYEKIGDLLDPAGAGDDRENWGIVTRLMNLNEIYDKDGNCPFELFGKENIAHFKLETGVIDLDAQAEMPANIGVVETAVRVQQEEEDSSQNNRRSVRGSSRDTDDRVMSETVLIDPLTKEEISKTFALDENAKKKYDAFGKPLYIEKDKWFRITAKLLWKKTPEQTENKQTF